MNMTHCSVSDCPNGVYAHDLCMRHYTRFRRYGDVSISHRPDLGKTEAERFWEKVEKSATCWLWTSAINWGGYAKFRIGKRDVYAHRWAYEHIVGPIPEGMDLDHLCRVRRCVRPDHLEPVTHQENVLRGEGIAARQAQKTHCPKGHEYTPENTRTYRGHRYCRTCSRERYVPVSQR